MGELSKAVNIGPKVEEQLFSVGITSLEKLKELGAKNTSRGINILNP